MNCAKSLLAVASLAALIQSLPAVAGAQTLISSVEADTGAGTVVINGYNLPAAPLVYMGRPGRGMDRLQVTRSGRSFIEADLRVTSPGTYLVAVLGRGMDLSAVVSMPVTIAPPGPAGPAGPQGAQGDAGADGIDCWDLNGNGTCDPAAEDLSGDGLCTALDCRGATGDTGPQGLPGDLALANESCPAGQYLTGFDGSGALVCSSVTQYCLESSECGPGTFCAKNACGELGSCQAVPDSCVALPVCAATA